MFRLNKAVLLGISLNAKGRVPTVWDSLRGDGCQLASSEPLEDPLLRELLAAFKEDSQRLAQDILNGLWLQAAVSLVALFLAVSSTVRLVLTYLYPFSGPFPGFRGREIIVAPDIALTIVLFILSIFSLNSYLVLRRRYSRLAMLAARLGR